MVGDGRTMVMVSSLSSGETCLLTFTTPTILATENGEVQIKTKLVEVPVDLLETLEKLSEIMKQLQASDRVTLLSESAVTTLSGRQTQMQQIEEKTIAGEKQILGPTIDVLADLSADKKSVTINLGMNLKREENAAP